ncbi:hypothetical protein GCM10023203_38000 [Actinomycetospora straminea]|uniref:Uncharacterized protein n=1 Tax=Actinomycetospora straminea TaxID=663607 RepID=A0ABP9EPT3_9PSEU
MNIPNWALITFAITIAAALAGWLTYLYFKSKVLSEESKRVEEEASKQAREVAEAVDKLREKMTLPSLINLNRLSLQAYEDIATGQANRSFNSGQRAMWVGFAWLLACIAGAALVPGADQKLLIGGFGAVGGGLAAFLGRTYLRVYETSLRQLQEFYAQPLLNSYYLSAERLVTDVGPNKRDEIKHEIIRALLTTAKQPNPSRYSESQPTRDSRTPRTKYRVRTRNKNSEPNGANASQTT